MKEKMKEGELAKLEIEGFKDSKFDKPTGLKYKVLFNPDEFVKNYELEYNEGKASGASSAQLDFKRIKPQTLELNLVFDGTGIVPEFDGISVEDQIEKFKKVALYYNGKIHAPPFVMIAWGKLIFKGILQNFKVTYNLFKPDGTPLRAKAVASFKETVNNKLRSAKENKQSADLTHIIKTKEGDTLPRLSFDIYGDSGYYMEIAKLNNLKSFRNLTTGSELIFPPLQK